MAPRLSASDDDDGPDPAKPGKPAENPDEAAFLRGHCSACSLNHSLRASLGVSGTMRPASLASGLSWMCLTLLLPGTLACLAKAYYQADL